MKTTSTNRVMSSSSSKDESLPLIGGQNAIKLRREHLSQDSDSFRNFKLDGDDPYGASVVYNFNDGAAPKKKSFTESLKDIASSAYRKAPYYIPIVTWLPQVR